MFKIELDTKDFIKMLEMISQVFIDLPIEIHKDGVRIRNISQTREVVITMDFDKKDMKNLEYDNKNNTFVNLPFGEFLDAVKKIKTPLEIGEEGTAKIYIKSDKIVFTLDKQQDVDKDLYTNHDGFVKKYPKTGRTKVVIGRGDFIEAVEQLHFTNSGITMEIADKKLAFTGLKGSLSAKYEIDVDVDTTFGWNGSFNSIYMKMIKNLAMYSKDVVFYVETPEEDEPLAVIVELAVAPNSLISFIMAGLKEDYTDADEEESESEEKESDAVEEEDDFDFEDEDESFYEEDED
jgi:hypothetical protein